MVRTSHFLVRLLRRTPWKRDVCACTRSLTPLRRTMVPAELSQQHGPVSNVRTEYDDLCGGSHQR